ncbi:MAG: ribosomal protein S18-alanine N-acetyltransferase [Gammaproteobacteria bacterium]
MAHIRPMHPSDVGAVTALEKQCQHYPWPAWLFRSMLRTTFTCRVIDVENRVVGYGVAQHKNGWVHLMNICIAKRFRGMGLGQKITLHLLNEARQHHIIAAWLEVRPTNHIAIRLYQSLGFRKARICKHYYPARGRRLPAIVMTRQL